MLGQGGIASVPGSTQGEIPTWPGIYYGVVSNNNDPKKQNRCLLRVPQILGSAVTTWAVSLTPLQNPPAVGTLIAAMFVGGDLDYPCYLVVDPKISVESSAGNIQPVGTTAAAGTSKNLAAADHVHTLANALESTAGNIHGVAATASAGTSSKAARADHVHAGQSAGSGGFNEISSSLASVGDTAALIDMYSQLTAGQSEIDLTATNVHLGSGGGTITAQGSNFIVTGSNVQFTGGTPVLSGMHDLQLNPPMATPPNYPLSTDTNTGSSWATGERSFINQIVTCVNALIASLQNRGLVN